MFISKSCDFLRFQFGHIGNDWSGSYGTVLWQCPLIRNSLNMM